MSLLEIDLNQSQYDWVQSQKKYHEAVKMLRNQGYVSPEEYLRIRNRIVVKVDRVQTLISKREDMRLRILKEAGLNLGKE